MKRDNQRLEAYADTQRRFWNTTDEHEATFARVDTVSHGDETKYNELAESTGGLLLRDIQLPDAPVLLEIGCGVGRLVQQMQRRVPFSRLYAVDLSKTMVDFAQKNAGADARISFSINSGYDLSGIPTGVVDFAYAVDVFIHVFDIDIIRNYIREVHRTLKPRGYFKFDVRFLNPRKMFGSSIGGRIACFAYKVGLRRADTHRWKPGDPAEFNGIKFRDRDLRRIVHGTELSVVSTFVRREDTHLWCLAQKP